MNFWDRVEYLLDRQDRCKKELAAAANIDPSTITKGKQYKSSPSAETAVLIAHYLGTTVEYLVTGEFSTKQEINIYYKHKNFINKFDKIPEETRSSIELMISDMSEKYSSQK